MLLFGYNSYQGSVWVSSANAVIGRIYEWDAAVKSFFSLGEVNERLTARNIELEQELSALKRNYMKHVGDTTEAELESKALLSRYTTIPAKVVGNSLNSPHNLITINRGRIDGVEGNMGVASGYGVVGVVYHCSEHYSVVMPVLNVMSHISCRIKGRDYFGYLQWDAREASHTYLEDIPFHAKCDVGDSIETSGYSSIFPEGLMVGTVVEKDVSDDGISYRLKIKLAVDFGNLRDVTIISDNDFAERARLMEAVRDSLDVVRRKNIMR